MDNHVLIIILVIVNVPVFIWLGKKLFFSTWERFTRAIWFWLKPDIISWFDGTYREDRANEFVLGLFILICGGLVFLEFFLITHIFLAQKW